jgi:uncharacterized membrane protein
MITYFALGILAIFLLLFTILLSIIVKSLMIMIRLIQTLTKVQVEYHNSVIDKLYEEKGSNKDFEMNHIEDELEDSED